MDRLTLNNDINEVLQMFPKLKQYEKNKCKLLSGEIDIFDSESVYLESYEINVFIPKNYPYGFPLLQETSCRFEHIADRHISTDGFCCVCSLQEADIVSQRGISIKNFFSKYVVPYFANQLYFQSEKHWANGDYEHGDYGIFQFYRELLKVGKLEDAISILSILHSKKLNRNDNCFCGKGKKIKHCHFEEYKKIKDLSKLRVASDLKILKSLEKEIKRKLLD